MVHLDHLLVEHQAMLVSTMGSRVSQIRLSFCWLCFTSSISTWYMRWTTGFKSWVNMPSPKLASTNIFWAPCCFRQDGQGFERCFPIAILEAT